MKSKSMQSSALETPDTSTKDGGKVEIIRDKDDRGITPRNALAGKIHRTHNSTHPLIWDRWYNVHDMVNDADDPLFFIALDCAQGPRELHICGVSVDGRLFHTYRDSSSNFQNFFGDVEPFGEPQDEFLDVGCDFSFQNELGEDPHNQFLNVFATTADLKVVHYQRETLSGWNFLGEITTDLDRLANKVTCASLHPAYDVIWAAITGEVYRKHSSWSSPRRIHDNTLFGIKDVACHYLSMGNYNEDTILRIFAITNDGELLFRTSWKSGDKLSDWQDISHYIPGAAPLERVSASTLRLANGGFGTCLTVTDSNGQAMRITIDNAEVWRNSVVYLKSIYNVQGRMIDVASPDSDETTEVLAILG